MPLHLLREQLAVEQRRVEALIRRCLGASSPTLDDMVIPTR